MPIRFVERRALLSTDGLSKPELAQLKAIGALYFGSKGPVRIADDDDGDPMETRTLSACDLWRVVDGGRHRYDAWFYMGDSGAIFEAGTTKAVAEIVQCGLECDDPDARGEIGAAMVAAKLLRRADGAYREFAAVLARQGGAAGAPAKKPAGAARKTATAKKAATKRAK